MEFLQSLDTNAIFGAFIALLTADFGVILYQVIASIKNRIKKFEYNKKIDELKVKFEKDFLQLQELTVGTLEKMEKTLEIRIADAKEAERKALEAQTERISGNVEAAKANLTIDQILED